jgi:hypothetical protein
MTISTEVTNVKQETESMWQDDASVWHFREPVVTFDPGCSFEEFETRLQSLRSSREALNN